MSEDTKKTMPQQGDQALVRARAERDVVLIQDSLERLNKRLGEADEDMATMLRDRITYNETRLSQLRAFLKQGAK